MGSKFKIITIDGPDGIGTHLQASTLTQYFQSKQQTVQVLDFSALNTKEYIESHYNILNKVKYKFDVIIVIGSLGKYLVQQAIKFGNYKIFKDFADIVTLHSNTYHQTTNINLLLMPENINYCLKHVNVLKLLYPSAYENKVIDFELEKQVCEKLYHFKFETHCGVKIKYDTIWVSDKDSQIDINLQIQAKL